MLKLEDGTQVKLNFAGVNDMPFKSIGDQLKQRGIKPDGGYSSDAVWTYLKKIRLSRVRLFTTTRGMYFSKQQPRMM